MNAKAKAKKNMIRLVALLLAAMMFIGMLASCIDTGEILGETFDYSAGLTEDGFFKDVTATEAVTLPDYTAYEIPQKLTVADRETLDAMIQQVIDNFTVEEKDVDKDRAIADGDKVNIDYVGTIDGEEFEGGSTKGNGTDVTIGVTNYIDDFIEQLKGHKPGENFDIEVTFPDDYGAEGSQQAELNGKDAVFNITINHYYKKIVPELTDEFVAENLGNYYKTVEEMKAGYEATIISNQKKDFVEGKLFEESEMLSYPEQMMNYEKEYLRIYLASYAAQMGLTAEDLVSLSGMESVDEYIASNEEAMKETVMMYTVVQAICEKEGIKVTDEDLTKFFKDNYGTEDYSTFEKSYGKPYLKFSAMRDVMLDKIMENMPVVETTEAE